MAAVQGRVPLVDSAGIALSTMKISEGIYLSTKRGREVTGDEVEKESKSSSIEV